MSLTNIADQRTPGDPTEVTLAPNQSLPNAQKKLVIIGAMGPTSGASSGSASPYTAVVVNNVASKSAAQTELAAKFGLNSQLYKQALAAVVANLAGPNYPPITCIPLPQGAVDFGVSDAALTVLDGIRADVIASPFDGTSATLRSKLVTQAQNMSAAARTANGQFGSIAVHANLTVTDPSTLPKPDTQYFFGAWLRDTGSNPYSVSELAAAVAARLASNPVPFNPQDSVVVPGVTAPVTTSDWIKVGAGLESETALLAGWCPLRVKANGDVALVRTVTGRITVDGTIATNAYIDYQDFNTLYYFREAVATRFAQPDFAEAKASVDAAKRAKGEIVRLAKAFEDATMFQAVAQLAPLIVVARSVTDRSRFDCYIPVNVVPGLHVIASNVQGTQLFDQFTA